jgi:uncharacterized protein YqjF (DUF2071 family)
MHQIWAKLLFIHWPILPDQLRPLIPARLQIDTFAETAWIGLTPFTMWGIRPSFLPAVPWLSTSHELNLRTYVHLNGVPGVWFFSLDASNLLAVLGARLGYSLPYFQARMQLREEGLTIHFTSSRLHRETGPADFEAVWTRGKTLPEAVPETLEFFLLERYCLYAAQGERLYRAYIHHRPWPLCQVTLSQLSSTMLASQGLSTPQDGPLLYGQAAPLHVEIWPPHQV